MSPADAAPVPVDLDRLTDLLVVSWGAIAAQAPGAAVRRVGDADAAIFPAGPSREVYNNAVLRRGAGDVAGTLDALGRAYAEAGVASFDVWAHEGERAAVEAAGWRPTEVEQAMSAALGGAAGGAAAAGATAGVDDGVERLDDPAEALALNGVGADLLPSWPAEGRWYGVRDADGLASAALGEHRDGDCWVSFVATREDARRRGHAARVMRRLLADAAAAGCATASLTSTEVAVRLYESVGFRPLGTMRIFQPAG